MSGTSVRVRGGSRYVRLARRLPLLCWLTLVWVLLWGRIDVGTVVFGAVVALLVTTVFPNPPIRTNIVLRPVRLLELVAYLGWDLLVSTLRVSWQALRHGPKASAGIVAVRLLTDSDHIIAMVANALSLAPGTFVLQIDRPHRLCYVYHLGMTAEDAEKVRGQVLRLEARVVCAVGSSEEIAIVRAAGGGK